MTIDTATGKEAPAELSSERVRSIFSNIAKKYENFNALSSFGAYRWWLKGMMKQAPISSESSVLDIAGGTGDVTFAVAHAKHPAHIQCTDLVPEMLDVARTHIEEGKAEGVPVALEVVDAQNIPYEDESYDALTMAYGIRNMPDRPRALREMYRVLKPGGALVCLEFSTPPNKVWNSLYTFYLRHIIPEWGRLLTGDKEGFVYLGKSIEAFPDQKGLARLMRDAGFVNVSWKNYTGGIAAVHVAYKPGNEAALEKTSAHPSKYILIES
jgi:demethylmenaquinone methyltransferase/2-methoxy-6-polyprenyl-1,4-benzoquinol methylase